MIDSNTVGYIYSTSCILSIYTMDALGMKGWFR